MSSSPRTHPLFAQAVGSFTTLQIVRERRRGGFVSNDRKRTAKMKRIGARSSCGVQASLLTFLVCACGGGTPAPRNPPPVVAVTLDTGCAGAPAAPPIVAASPSDTWLPMLSGAACVISGGPGRSGAPVLRFHGHPFAALSNVQSGRDRADRGDRTRFGGHGKWGPSAAKSPSMKSPYDLPRPWSSMAGSKSCTYSLPRCADT